MDLSTTFVQQTIRALDALARAVPWKKTNATPKHLITGHRGEEEAYFHLRKLGYVMIARNYRSPRSRSELDLVGWDDQTLCFIEVKTRTTHDVKPAEMAVDREKQQDLARVAREFLRKIKGEPAIRFDIVSVYAEAGKPPQIMLFKDAFHA
jgi:putative endonuclease